MDNDHAIRPFTYTATDDDLTDLQARLDRTRWTDAIHGSGWTHGVDPDDAKALLAYWRTGFDWRATEARLNAFPQFMTTIDGIDIHFLHIRSTTPAPTPLLLIHGWPDSVLEYLDLIGPLIDPESHGTQDAPAFDLVIPSIPGYGFSSRPAETGWGADRTGVAFAELMHRLGYDRYAVHGGDLGSSIARAIAIADPEHVIGIHVLEFFSYPNGSDGEFDGLNEEDHARLQAIQEFQEVGTYFAMQGARPQTVGFGLADSPVAQLTWNLDFMTAFGASNALTRDQILENVTLYWLTNTGGSAARFYYENQHGGIGDGVNTTPTAFAGFANNMKSIRRFAERDNSNIVRWTEFDRGGHFAAMDSPDLLIPDIRAFFRDVQ